MGMAVAINPCPYGSAKIQHTTTVHTGEGISIEIQHTALGKSKGASVNDQGFSAAAISGTNAQSVFCRQGGVLGQRHGLRCRCHPGIKQMDILGSRITGSHLQRLMEIPIGIVKGAGIRRDHRQRDSAAAGGVVTMLFLAIENNAAGTLFYVGIVSVILVGDPVSGALYFKHSVGA